jgi:hypothetical protein
VQSILVALEDDKNTRAAVGFLAIQARMPVIDSSDIGPRVYGPLKRSGDLDVSWLNRLDTLQVEEDHSQNTRC